jgi:hypothetical protein
MDTMKEWCKELKMRLTPEQRKTGEFLESKGKKFLVDFGYSNAEEIARKEFNYRATVDIGTLNGKVLNLLRRDKYQWWVPWELCEKLHREEGTRISDSCVTARLRDLRKPQYGLHNIEKRRREGSQAYEYHLGK